MEQITFICSDVVRDKYDNIIYVKTQQDSIQPWVTCYDINGKLIYKLNKRGERIPRLIDVQCPAQDNKARALRKSPTHILRFAYINNKLLMTYAVAKNNPCKNEVDVFSKKEGNERSLFKMEQLIERQKIGKRVIKIKEDELKNNLPNVVINTLLRYLNMAIYNFKIKSQDQISLEFYTDKRNNTVAQIYLKDMEVIYYSDYKK